MTNCFGRQRRASALSLILFLAGTYTAAPGAHAFGADGHRIVGELAQRQLTATARAEVERLLAEEPEPTLAGISNWADEVRDRPEYRWSAPLHYVNFQRNDCSYRARRDCPAGRCVVAALERYAREIGDANQPMPVRREALKWFVHFAGDIHQPLHTAYVDDKGGNTFQVFYAGRSSNLHTMWDTHILRLPKRKWRSYADLLATRQVEGDVRWSAHAPRRWAEQSCRLIDEAGIYPDRPGRLGRDYAERHLPLVERQLVLAGARLAALLNATLGTTTQR